MQKNLQYLPLQFFDVDDFKAVNVKFPLDMALAFFNANALMGLAKPIPFGQVPMGLPSLLHPCRYVTIVEHIAQMACMPQ